MSDPIEIRDRQTGRIVEERVFGERSLRFLYGSAAGHALLNGLLKRPVASRVYGLMQRSPASRRKIPRFIESLGIDGSEASRPLSDYRSLDDFFARELRPGARPIDLDPARLISPADGRVLAFDSIPATGLPVKGAAVSISVLLGDAESAARYAGGSAAIVRLAPADYHRFHFPDSGNAMEAREIGHDLHSVHPIALRSGAPSFANKRMVSILTSQGFGDIAIVEVGALCVGTIIQTYRPSYVERGEEKGLFRFGGSSVVLLLEAGRIRFDDDLLASTREGIEVLVRMGTRIGARP
ncbi:MAG: phosphatidylserine decarboxylase [Acidobacteriota bacterium]